MCNICVDRGMFIAQIIYGVIWLKYWFVNVSQYWFILYNYYHNFDNIKYKYNFFNVNSWKPYPSLNKKLLHIAFAII